MAKLRLQLLTALNRRLDAMQKKRRNGRALAKTSVEDEIAHLRGLDLGGLRARWHSAFQRQAPAHLTRHQASNEANPFCRRAPGIFLPVKIRVLSVFNPRCPKLNFALS
jgi:hypothetical protein